MTQLTNFADSANGINSQTTREDAHSWRWIALACLPSFSIGLLNGTYLGTLFSINPILFWIADALHFVGLTVFAVIVLATKLRIHPRDYGFVSPDPKLHWVQFALLTFVIFLWTWFIYVVTLRFAQSHLPWNAIGFAYPDALAPGGAQRTLGLIYLSLSAGFAEETIFRAIPWLVFRRKFAAPMVPYVLFTSIAFGLIHWETGLGNVVATTVLGVVFAWIYVRLGNIWPLIAAHALIDYVLFR